MDIGTTLKLGWDNNASATSYTLNYRIAGGTAWIAISSATNSVKLSNLLPGTNYECRLYAFGSSGLISVSASGTFATINEAYTKTKDIGTTCQIDWAGFDFTPALMTYQYKLSTSNAWTGVNVSLPTRKMTGMTPDASYDCQVVIYAPTGGLWGVTQQSSFTMGHVTYAASNKTITTTTALDVTWTANNCDLTTLSSGTYFYYRVQGATSWVSKILSGSANTIHLTSLTNNTTYECYVVPVISGTLWGGTQTGTFSTSATAKESQASTSNEMKIYPNPFVDQLNIDMYADQDTKVTWNIYDMTGKVVLNGSESVTSGYSTLNISVGDLPKGVYMFAAILNDKMQSFRILKQ